MTRPPTRAADRTLEATVTPPSDTHPCIMSDLLNNPKHWQERAEDARRVAEQMDDMEARKTMFKVAEAYTHLAERAQLRIGKDQN
jgi:hypothetical protein